MMLTPAALAAPTTGRVMASSIKPLPAAKCAQLVARFGSARCRGGRSQMQLQLVRANAGTAHPGEVCVGPVHACGAAR